MNHLLCSTLIHSIFPFVRKKSDVLLLGANRKDENSIGLITSVVQSPFYDPSLDNLAIKNDMLKVLPVLRRIRACYSQPAKIFTAWLNCGNLGARPF